MTRRAGKHLYFSVEEDSHRDDEDANIFDPLDILLLSEEKGDFGRSNTSTNTETLNTATRMMVMTTTVGYVGLTTDINSVVFKKDDAVYDDDVHCEDASSTPR